MCEARKPVPDCYQCRHRRGLVGDAHSACAHPNVTALTVRGNAHGIRRQWFRWPHNFDPVWLLQCDGFEPVAVPKLAGAGK